MSKGWAAEEFQKIQIKTNYRNKNQVIAKVNCINDFNFPPFSVTTPIAMYIFSAFLLRL